jgi:hypothetical protein
MLERGDFRFEGVGDALNEELRAFSVFFIAVTGFISTYECNFIAVVAATDMSGWFGGRTSFRDGLRNGEGNLINSLIELRGFHGVKCVELI